MEIEDECGYRAQSADFAFDMGEEVLARLPGRAVTDDVGSPVPAGLGMPTWTIGTIISPRWSGSA